jgi:transcriptional regulator with XRE-family HTH domain
MSQQNKTEKLREGLRGETLGERIHNIRECFGLSMEQFGQAIGVDKSYISRIESNKNSNLGRDKLMAIEEKYRISKEWLLTGAGCATMKPTAFHATHSQLGVASSYDTVNDNDKKRLDEISDQRKEISCELGVLNTRDAELLAEYLEIMRRNGLIRDLTDEERKRIDDQINRRRAERRNRLLEQP